MSTRITLWYSEDLHLYQDGFDDENVYLEIRSQYFDALVVKIPLSAWKAATSSVMRTISRRRCVRKVRYFVWLFILGR